MAKIKPFLDRFAPTQTKLAERLGLDPSNISLWMRKKHIPWKQRVRLLQLAEEGGFKEEAEAVLFGSDLTA